MERLAGSVSPCLVANKPTAPVPVRMPVKWQEGGRPRKEAYHGK